jgi:SPOR domain
MRPPSPIEPFIPSEAITLHPTLQAVLDNLDVQIDAELSRYRRQRRNPNGRNPNVAPHRRSIAATDPTAIGILKKNIQLPQPRSSIYDSSYNPPQAAAAVKPSAQRPVPASVAQSVAQSAPIQSWVAPAHPLPKAAPVAAPAGPPPDSAAIASYAEQYDLSTYAPDSVLQRLMQQLEPVASAVPPAPAADDEYRDYLASSEELLRSIAEEDGRQQTEQEPNSLLDTLLTPLGIGSMLLLLLSSTTLGYVMMNPSSIGLNPAEQKPPVPETALRSAETENSVAPGTVPSPNLAADEFRSLGLDTLSSIPKSGQSGSRSTAPSTAKSGAASSSKQPVSSEAKPPQSYTAPKARTELPIVSATELPPAPAIEPSLSTVVIPAQPPAAKPVQPARRAAPQPAISPEPISIAPPPVVPIQPASPTVPSAAPSNAPSSAPSNAPTASNNPAEPSGRYYVVTEYSGDPSLRQAREAVPDAYVRNIPAEGAKVQLGAFSDEAKAQELQQTLRQQGIEAEVYRP